MGESPNLRQGRKVPGKTWTFRLRRRETEVRKYGLVENYYDLVKSSSD